MRRYVALGRVEQARADLALGNEVDHDVVDAVLHDLDRLAGLEAWRCTAFLAREAKQERWRTAAEERAARLVRAAPDERAAIWV
jgi:hypothetical protein